MEQTKNKERFLRLHEILARTGLSRSTLYAQVSEGRFPEPVNIGERSVAWLESEVDAWINQKIKQSRN